MNRGWAKKLGDVVLTGREGAGQAVEHLIFP